jgi:predicted HNH restriction endonuclease
MNSHQSPNEDPLELGTLKLVPLYEIKKEYSVNPTTDLIPVCANCHAMLHRGRKTISIEALKEHIHNAN